MMPGAPAGWRPCTRATPRCEYWTWTADYVRPACCTAHLKDLLRFTAALLTRHRIRFWVDWGTLLGAVREGDLIAWDSDVDLGVLAEDLPRVAALHAEIVAAGHTLQTAYAGRLAIGRSVMNTQHVDVYPWRAEGDRLVLGTPDAEERWAFPAAAVARMTQVRMEDRAFPAPADPPQFLARYRYGPDWRTPRRPPPPVPRAVQSFVARRRFEQNLVRLHDVLARSPLAGRYWVIGGLLIGWAREGRALDHDLRDADFALLADDHEAFLAAVPALAAAGFEPAYRYLANDGDVVEYKLLKDGANFDFFLHDRPGARLRYRYFCFPATGAVEMTGEIEAHGLSTMSLLDRTWLKPDDHDAYLTALYGDWRVPRPDFSNLTEDRSVTSRRPWRNQHHVAWPARGATEAPA
ncbi:MAG: LicD family protein [Candidatus Rokubacteria bacterium]|nr:LicD family protein [Candidatus Rokubacteria bacterium]